MCTSNSTPADRTADAWQWRGIGKWAPPTQLQVLPRLYADTMDGFWTKNNEAENKKLYEITTNKSVPSLRSYYVTEAEALLLCRFFGFSICWKMLLSCQSLSWLFVARFLSFFIMCLYKWLCHCCCAVNVTVKCNQFSPFGFFFLQQIFCLYESNSRTFRFDRSLSELMADRIHSYEQRWRPEILGQKGYFEYILVYHTNSPRIRGWAPTPRNFGYAG